MGGGSKEAYVGGGGGEGRYGRVGEEWKNNERRDEAAMRGKQ